MPGSTFQSPLVNQPLLAAAVTWDGLLRFRPATPPAASTPRGIMPGSPLQSPLAAALLVALLTIAVWSKPTRSLKSAAALAVALLIAALTWAGLLRFRPNSPPDTGLTGEPELSACGVCLHECHAR